MEILSLLGALPDWLNLKCRKQELDNQRKQIEAQVAIRIDQAVRDLEEDNSILESTLEEIEKDLKSFDGFSSNLEIFVYNNVGYKSDNEVSSNFDVDKRLLFSLAMERFLSSDISHGDISDIRYDEEKLLEYQRYRISKEERNQYIYYLGCFSCAITQQGGRDALKFIASNIERIKEIESSLKSSRLESRLKSFKDKAERLVGKDCQALLVQRFKLFTEASNLVSRIRDLDYVLYQNPYAGLNPALSLAHYYCIVNVYLKSVRNIYQCS